MDSQIIVEVTGNALTVDAKAKVISSFRDNAAMTEFFSSLFCVVMSLDNESAETIVSAELDFLKK